MAMVVSDNFWLGFITAASALAGFTLASYSIFVSRIEIAAADTICRRYLFKECTSQYSLAYILFALTMFIVPLALSLNYLFEAHNIDESWRTVASAGETLFVVFLLLINWKQLDYGWKLIRYNRELKKQNEVVDENRPVRRSFDLLHFVLAVIMILLSWVVLLANLGHLNARVTSAGVWILNFGLVDWLVKTVPAELSAAISLFVGLALVSWHFYLFDPARLVFESNYDTIGKLRETSGNIDDALKRLEPVQSWLRVRVANAEESLNHLGPQFATEAALAKVLMESAKEFLEGNVSSVVDSGRKTLWDRGQNYHKPWLAFCMAQRVMRFSDIVWLMNGIDLYMQAMSNFEQRLKEMPEQLPLLRPIDPERLNQKKPISLETV